MTHHADGSQSSDTLARFRRVPCEDADACAAGHAPELTFPCIGCPLAAAEGAE